MKITAFVFLLFTGIIGFGQLNIENGAIFTIETGASVIVEGNVVAASAVLGDGKLVMKGSALQNINLGGNNVNNLEIDNTFNVLLTGNAKAAKVVNFLAGKVILGENNFELGSACAITGAGIGKFFETNGEGLLSKVLSAATEYKFDLGNGTDYTPLTCNLTALTPIPANSSLGAKSAGQNHPLKHVLNQNFLNTYWKISRINFTGGTLNAVGTYVDPSDISGMETKVFANKFINNDWQPGSAIDYSLNTVTADFSSANGDLFAMGKSIIINAKVLLQGAYDNATGLMKDTYRTILPTTDPYRSAPYNTAFTHVNNPVSESTIGTPFADKLIASENIVDWVFLELRMFNIATVAPVLQTRAALIQRDGTIVDVDGTSPVYFNNVEPGAYVFSVRHRNHLGLSTNPTATINLNAAKTAVDFTTAAPSALYGIANENYAFKEGKNLMFGGNANMNSNIKYVGLSTDLASLLVIMANPNSWASPGRPITTTADYQQYAVGDVNFNKNVSYVGLNTDNAFILSTPLGGNSNPIPTISQKLPN